MIPCGSKILPRTPFHGGAALDKEETTEPQKSTQNSSQENKIKANFIPCGLNIPRTPFNVKDMTKSLEDAGKSVFFRLFQNRCPRNLYM